MITSELPDPADPRGVWTRTYSSIVPAFQTFLPWNEVWQTRYLLFPTSPNCQSVTQKPVAHLSLAPSANFGDRCYRAGHRTFGLQGCAKPPHFLSFPFQVCLVSTAISLVPLRTVTDGARGIRPTLDAPLEPSTSALRRFTWRAEHSSTSCCSDRVSCDRGPGTACVQK